MLSKHEEEAERRATLLNDQSVKDQRIDPATLKTLREIESRPGGIERVKAQMEAERKRASTLMEHVEPPVGGRHAQPQTVVGKSPGDPWPKLPETSPWSGAQPEPGRTEPCFGKQLHSVDRGRR